MDISKKVIFKTFYNQYSEISEKDNQDIYLLDLIMKASENGVAA